MEDSKVNRKWNYIYKRHVEYISQKISHYTAKQYSGIVMVLYIKYMIAAVLHGYRIVIPHVVSFSLSRIPVKDIYKYRGYKFKSKLTSDWLFYIDMENNLIKKNDLKYVPTRSIMHKAKEFLNTEKVYELIR